MPNAPKRSRAGRPAPAGSFFRGPVALWFTLGLLCRLVVFTGPHAEGDEIVYRTLVYQLETGHGYNLIGSPIIGPNWPADQYGNALFFHPPGGIGLFWLLHLVVGDAAFPVVQILCYALFFWSMLALARVVLAPFEGLKLHMVAALTAFTPIMAQVMSRYWLDGPLLAVTTLAAVLFIAALARRDTRAVVVAALVMGGASWIKTAALVAVPGMLLLAWALARPGSEPATLRLGFIFVAVAAAVQLPWELWQWSAVGSPFPAWAGRPSPVLVANNAYVHSLTVDRPAWMYLTLMPRALWTLVPSLACLATPRFDPRARRIALSLLGWIAVVLAAVIGLGAIGYSKLLRYAILITPATVLLFGLAAGEAWSRLADPRLTPGEKSRARLLVGFAAVGLALEIAQGVYTPLFDRTDDLIKPVLWPDSWFF